MKMTRYLYLLFSGWRWAEDSFQSSPNSVTKTQFRNKILRDTFPFPPLAADLRRQRCICTSHHQYSPAGSLGWRLARRKARSVSWAPDTNELLCPQNHAQDPQTKSPARDSRVLPKPRPLISDSSHLTYHLQTFFQDDPSTQVHVTV